MSESPVRRATNTCASLATPASVSTRIASGSRFACGLIHRPGPSEPNPAQASRVRTTCLARRSDSGMRTCASTHWPSHFAAGPKE